jgi:putative multiple sugar transport system permease protein
MAIAQEERLPASAETESGLGVVRKHMREYGILIALVVIMAFFQIATDGVLLRPVNITNVVLQNSYIVIMAVGMLLVIVAGHIDLSVGSVMGFIGAVAAVLMVTYGFDYITASIICLAIGAMIGAAQGFWIAYYRIPSFIVTLAGMLVFKGLALGLLGGKSIGPFPREFQALASGFIPDLFTTEGLAAILRSLVGGGENFNLFSLLVGVATAVLLSWMAARSRAQAQKYGQVDEPFGFFAAKTAIIAAAIVYLSWLMAAFRGFPNVLIVMALLIGIYSFVTSRTTFGRRIYALGGNENAARLSGIDTKRLTFLTFVNMGVLSALAGLVFAARLNTATPKAGLGFELDVIAAVFIGGASMSGGIGTVVGAVVGAFIMGVMNNGMSILGIGIDWQQGIKGMVLLAAVIFDVYNKNKA